MQRRLKKRLAMGLVAVATVAGSAYAMVPKTWQAGDQLTAADLNANFESLDATRAVAVGPGGTTFTTNAVFAQRSSNQTNGRLMHAGGLAGYRAAKLTCEDTVGSTTAHMCDAAELSRSLQLGIVLPDGDGWYAAGQMFFDGTIYTNDCGGWLNTTSNGAVWQVRSGGTNEPARAPCDQLYQIMCCD